MDGDSCLLSFAKPTQYFPEKSLLRELWRL
jgi:hypothetical protein